jgi:predicted porin
MNLKVMGAAALFLSAATFGGMSARAADLGGDCCADLEERVAELEATTARKGNRKVSLEVYGQVTTALLHFDNGDVSDTFVGDNSNSPSRFGFKGSAKISPNVRAGFHIEVGAISAPLSGVTVTDDDGGQPGDGALSVRFANWYLDHKSLGRVTVGRISSAMDGIQEIDLVGTSVVSLPGINIGNKLAIGGSGGLVTWDMVMRGFDGDRVNGIRYDTPTYNGFQLSTSFSEDDRYDVTLRYAGEFGGFRVAAGIGYGYGDDNSDRSLNPFLGANGINETTLLSGSASVLHVSSGLFLTAFAGRREVESVIGDYDERNWGARAGIAKNWFGIGNTVLFGEYNYFDNINALGAESEIWGLGVVQNVDAAAMELFLSYKNYSLDVPGAKDMDVIFSGARIKF